MAKKPKIGDEIVSDLDDTIVTDPVPEAPPADPAPEEFVPLVPPDAYIGDSALLEDGTRVLIGPNQLNGWRVYGLNGTDCYEHVHTADDGEWVYRKV